MEFLKNNVRFSFLYDGKNGFKNEFSKTIEETENQLTTVYSFKDGLKITNIAKKYSEHGAYEWVNYIENTSDKPSGIISELWDCDCTLPIDYEDERREVAYYPEVEDATKIYSPTGSTWSPDEFYCDIDVIYERERINHIHPGQTKSYSTTGGRSSVDKAPFFNIHKCGKGYIFAVGWTGQWKADITRTHTEIIFKSKIQDTYFRVMPGEVLRTSSVVMMPYESDVIDSQNKWRRLVKEHFSLIGKEGRAEIGPLCAGIWGGTRSDIVLERIDIIKRNNLPFDYIWMDSGWFGTADPSPDEFEAEWWNDIGDWRVSPAIHPNGLKDVSKAVHDAGMKFLLWFEPERAMKDTPITKSHPEYLLFNNDPNTCRRLLNLGNEEAWNYCFELMSKIIEELNIDCFRQDFNVNPLEYFEYNDEPDRKGITEIKHITGMYRLWDALLEKFPHLIIDNCASGGRRLDIETLRRSIPLWRSDYQCPANYDIEVVQCHHMSYNTWLPYAGTGTGRGFDEYRIRSAYASSISAAYFYNERIESCDAPEKIEFMRKYFDEYLKVRPYFSEDFYPLTQFSTTTDSWCAMQFDRPSQNDGIVEVYKRENSPYDTAKFKLRGIDEKADYIFTDTDGGEFTVSGKQLVDDGLTISIIQRPKAKIYIYKKK